jgi:hypothetical protein
MPLTIMLPRDSSWRPTQFSGLRSPAFSPRMRDIAKAAASVVGGGPEGPRYM